MFVSQFAFCSDAARRVCLLWLLALVVTMANPLSSLHADDWPPVDMDRSTAKIEAALKDLTAIEFIETPLQDVVDFLKDLHGIEIQIDARALEDVGIGSDTPITRNLKGITLRSALRLMLKELDLTYVLRDEVLLITTPEETEADADPIVQVYHVEPLLDDEHGVDKLIDTIESAFDDKLAMRTATFRGLLIVRGTSRQHQELRQLLGIIAKALDVEPAKPVVEPERPMPMGRARAEQPDDPQPDEPQADPFGGGGADPFGGGAHPFGGAPDPNQVDPFAN